MKIPFIHWPTLWHFCSQENWAIPLAGSFCASLMFISATVHFMINNGIFALTSIISLVLTVVSVSGFVICLKLLSKVYYAALLDVIGVPTDAHIVDKIYAGKSLKLLSEQEIQELRAGECEITDDLYQIKYRYRVNQWERIGVHSLSYDEIFDYIELGQRIPITVLPCRIEITKVDEDYLMKQYREQMTYWWTQPASDSPIAEFKNGY